MLTLLFRLPRPLLKSAFIAAVLVVFALTMMPLPEMLKKPIYSVMSGPTLAPMAALALSDEPDIIVGDMGGTTFDVSALRDHQIIITPDSMIHDDSLGIPKVDVRSVGAGGGSIAHVDAGGLLNVGPQSAGARPGPACYGHGGTVPAMTDALVQLGWIRPHRFLGEIEAALGALFILDEREGLEVFHRDFFLAGQRIVSRDEHIDRKSVV